jgi:hypothetical protein
MNLPHRIDQYWIKQGLETGELQPVFVAYSYPRFNKQPIGYILAWAASLDNLKAMMAEVEDSYIVVKLDPLAEVNY